MSLYFPGIQIRTGDATTHVINEFASTVDGNVFLNIASTSAKAPGCGCVV